MLQKAVQSFIPVSCLSFNYIYGVFWYPRALNFYVIKSLSLIQEEPGVRKWKRKSLSHVWLFVTWWTIQSMGFSRPEYWSGEPFPSPGDLPNPGIEPRSPALWADALPAELGASNPVSRLHAGYMASSFHENSWSCPLRICSFFSICYMSIKNSS